MLILFVDVFPSKIRIKNREKSPTMILKIIFLYTKKRINLKVRYFMVTNESKDIHVEILV